MTPEEAKEVKEECLFFGVWEHAGHYLYYKSGQYVRDNAVPEEFGRLALDGIAFAATPYERHKNWPQPLGVTRTQHITAAKDGSVWTVLSMWDRSGDHRLNSNASFLIKGVYSTEAMWALARRDFPKIAARIFAYTAG